MSDLKLNVSNGASADIQAGKLAFGGESLLRQSLNFTEFFNMGTDNVALHASLLEAGHYLVNGLTIARILDNFHHWSVPMKLEKRKTFTRRYTINVTDLK